MESSDSLESPSCLYHSFIVSHRINHSRPGFLLLEAIIGIAVFALFLTAVGVVLLHGQENSVVGGDRVRGTTLAGEVLDAARAIRDGDFAALTAGDHGVELDASQQWIFSGVRSTRSGGYILTGTVTSLAADHVRVTAQTRWKHGYNRSGSVLLTTEITNWRGSSPAGDWASVVLDGSYIDAGTPLFNAAAVAGNYLYVTGDTTSGGVGLYVFDISDITAPIRVASSFDLGTSGYGIALKSRTLYVATGDSAQEIRAYDITAPASLSAANLVTSIDLSGSGLARSLLLRGNILLAGTIADVSSDEVYSFDVTNTGAIMPVTSQEISAAVNGIGLSGTSAFLATNATGIAEMTRVSLSSTGALSAAVNGSYNLTDRDGGSLSVAVSGTAALLGGQKAAVQELAFFNPQNGGGAPPSCPLGNCYHEGSGSLVGVAADPANCYGFLAAASGRKALQVINLRDPALAELTNYTSVNGLPRAMLYDIVRDRVYLFTNTALLVLRSASTPGTCM